MNRMVLPIVLIAWGCSQADAPSDTVVEESKNESDWIVYDGRIPLDEKRTLSIELSIKSGENPNEGNYQLKETEEGGNGEEILADRKGIFSAEYQPESGEWVLLFHNSAQANGVRRVYNTNRNTIREERFRKDELMLKRAGENLMIVLDNERQPITTEIENNLVRRTSRLFTVEGYFTYKGNTAEFFEMNTRERWHVSKRGEFFEAARQYHTLAKEKFESLYLKAVAYSIHAEEPSMDGREALVFKRIIQTSSSPISE